MAFISIINGSTVFNSAGTGKYVNAAIPFGGPADYYQISPSRKVKGKTDVLTTSIMRYAELPPAVAGGPRPYFRITIQVECHTGMPLINVDSGLSQVNEFVTEANLTRLFNGEV